LSTIRLDIPPFRRDAAPVKLSAAIAALVLLLAACAPYNGAPLAGDPNGTVDSTHGPNGAQTTPR